MIFWNIIGLLIIWSVLGLIVFNIFGEDTRIDDGKLDFLTPKWIYHNYEVNWFGAFCLTLLFNLMCPLMSIGFWFYKLCTVGRK